jgi:hypothetical protein
MFHIGKRETLVLDNVVATLAPELTSAVGAIRIDSDTYASFEFIAAPVLVLMTFLAGCAEERQQAAAPQQPANARTSGPAVQEIPTRAMATNILADVPPGAARRHRLK